MNLQKPEGKIDFPVSFKLKIISFSYDNENSAYHTFGKVLENNKIPHSNWDNKPSSGGKYTSYRVDVKINDQETFKKLYSSLGKIDGVKCVL